MKKTRLAILTLLLFLILKAATASIIITEFMYAPNQTASHTDGEWIEIYNNGLEVVDLSDWKIDGYNFDDVSISPEQYIVVARELIDGSDVDNESFETAWGNSDGIWDGSDGDYVAVDGYFQLGEDDVINLTNGIETEILVYNSSFGANGNGKTIERINLNLGDSFDNLAESLVSGGTPGKENSANNEDGVNNSNEVVDVQATVNNIQLIITNISLSPDDSTASGIQVMPNVNADKTVTVTVEVWDGNGFEDLVFVEASLDSKVATLNFVGNVSSTVAIYEGNFVMSHYDPAQDYTIAVVASDGISEVTSEVTFEYLGIMSTTLSTYSVNFGSLDPGSDSATQTVTVSNSGNVIVDVELSGTNLQGSSQTLSVDNIQFWLGQLWQSLTSAPQMMGLNVQPNTNHDLNFRLKVPTNTKPDNYNGEITITSVAK